MITVTTYALFVYASLNVRVPVLCTTSKYKISSKCMGLSRVVAESLASYRYVLILAVVGQQ